MPVTLPTFPSINFAPYNLLAGDDTEIITKTAGMATALGTLQTNINAFGTGTAAAINTALAAVEASNGLFYMGVTSTTSATVGLGSKAFTVADKKAFAVGQRVRVINTASIWMEGEITAATATVITVNVDSYLGTGTLAVWAFALTGAKGMDYALPQVQYLAATASNSTVTLATVGTISFNLVAGGIYQLDAYLDVSSAATTTGLSLALGGTATLSKSNGTIDMTTAAGVTTLIDIFKGTASTFTGVYPNTGTPLRLNGIVTCSVAGTLLLQFASEITGSAVSIIAPSVMIVRKLN